MQMIGKIFGSSYDISVLIVTPNVVHHEGNKILGDDTEDEISTTSMLQCDHVSFRYPSKPDVKILKDVNIDVKQN